VEAENHFVLHRSFVVLLLLFGRALPGCPRVRLHRFFLPPWSLGRRACGRLRRPGHGWHQPWPWHRPWAWRLHGRLGAAAFLPCCRLAGCRAGGAWRTGLPRPWLGALGFRS
jgi:hypothetical protein